MHNKNVAQEAYAAGKLSEVVLEKGYTLVNSQQNYDHLINLAIHKTALKAEAFSIIPENKIITITGGDYRGLIYGVFDLIGKLENGVRLDSIKPDRQAPKIQFRGIKYNLPWETYRPSSALDQHLKTAKDLSYWEAFLDMLVENRFNAVSLWNMHPYTSRGQSMVRERIGHLATFI